MSIFGGIIINATYILFPLTIYLIYSAYTKNLDLKEKSIILELALYSSLYMLIRYGVMFKSIYPALLFSLPLVISLIKNKKTTSIIIATILIVFNYYKFHFNIYFLIVEHLLYIMLAFLFESKNKETEVLNSFLLIKILAMTYQTIFFIMSTSNYIDMFTYILFSAITLSFFSYLIIFCFKKCELIVNYNSTLNELNREKTIRNSLFKITHEVKNPLAVCRGYLDMLDLEDQEKYKEYIPIISKEINRTLNLMDDFLDYTKIKVEKEDTDIYMLLEDIKEEISPLLKQNNIISEFIIPDDELYLELDYNRIKQVFINIYKNSIEAKKKNMKISLKAYKRKNQLIIKVSDNGVGMSKETLKHIGENFYTTKQNGTGLGVSLSKEIISLHEGRMYYKSIKDKGTDVFIELPVK